jgi:predicted ATPase
MPDSGGTTAFGALLRQQRLIAGLTQATLAERAGLAARTVQDLELGIARPRRETVRRLVDALRLPPEIRARFEAVTPAPRDRARRLDRVATTDAPGVAASRSHLPVPLTSLVGRESDLVALAGLRSARLLSLTGVGGVGKTRLALAAARAAEGDYENGVWLVELAALSESTLVPQAVARALGIAEQARRPLVETLVDVLAARRLLLVLDNCEHLLDACAALVQRLLAGCPDVRVLATSREPLGVDGEVVWRVPPLTVPDGEASTMPTPNPTEYSAMRLFVDRARQIQTGFALTDESVREVVEICRRLDGIPLAIELAAARVSSLAVGQIAARLDDEMALLTRGPRTAAPRHRTLRGTLDWSYDLLAEPEQTLLRRLAVFAGGWTLDAAESICAGDGIDRAGVLDLLSQLVDASLVIVEECSGEARYRLLEPVRQYALGQLQQTADETAVRDRHAIWCLALAERAEPELWLADQLVWFARLEVEHDNLRTALSWSVGAGHDSEVALRLAGALCHFWDMGGYWGEGHQWLDHALQSAANDNGPASVRALTGAGFLAFRAGIGPRDFARATRLHTQALDLAKLNGDTRHVALALSRIAQVAQVQGQYEAARQLHEEALALARHHADKLGIARTLDLMGRLAEWEGDYPRAVMVLEEALTLHRERGDRVSAAWTISMLGLVVRRQGAYERAISLGEESLALYRGLRDRNGLAFVLQNLGRVMHLQGDYARARSMFEESVQLWRDIGSRTQALRSLEGLAGVIGAQGHPDRAVRLLVATETLSASIGRALSRAERDVFDQLLSAARAELDDTEYASACVEGRAMTFDEAVSYALEEFVRS